MEDRLIMIRGKFPKNIFGVTDARSGSTYLFDSIAKVMRKINHNHVYLFEGFHPYYQKRHIRLDENQEILCDRTEIEALPDHKRLKVKYAQRNAVSNHICDCMINAKNSWSLKMFPVHYNTAPHNKIHYLLNQKSTYNVFLYRKDLEDKILSKLFAEKSKLYNTEDPDDISKTYDNFSITYNKDNDHYFIREYLRYSIELKNLYPYTVWDQVYCYEDLTGDPVTDLTPIFGDKTEEYWSLTRGDHFQKALDKQDKIDRITNYKQFEDDLWEYLKFLGLRDKILEVE